MQAQRYLTNFCSSMYYVFSAQFVQSAIHESGLVSAIGTDTLEEGPSDFPIY